MSRNFKVGFFLVLAILTTTFTFYFWQLVKTPNFQVNKKTSFALYIPEGATYDQVLDSLNRNDVVADQISFRFLAKFLDLPENIKPGRYLLKPDMSNYEAVKKLTSGDQDPVKLTFNNIRLKQDLVSRIGSRFAFGEENFGKALSDPTLCAKYGFDTTTIISMFLPNTYDIFWTTGTEKFMDRMHSEYQKFWNPTRMAKADSLGLTPIQVSILASIVEEEQARKVDERPMVAGLYLNRLKAGMPLQADPTIKFALQDFAIKRILNDQLRVRSPYNTYVNTGLPPGPIRIADLNSLNAVLDYKDHEYIYMCAKSDLSGYHAFAKTYAEHLKNAREYQTELNRLKIMK
ncbi:endolytic transglycosylase MltG [Dyadobacter tibetensis]|uniref:endolytic transglycosylase MltG n=1 Tax=Dyadobacter tibetensis TaxID=1211851 RepID=UPI000472FAA8|nr:endolytic transglycosylase MltG [Dyadobacter tibetensis]